MKEIPSEEEIIIKIYTPASQLKSPGVFLRDMFIDLIKGKDLAWQLTVRDIRAKYRQSFLGILWAFILPIANTITWIFLSKTGIVKLEPTGIPYPLYVFSGTMLWSIFMESLQSPLVLSNAAKKMLSKINFPREAIIVSGIFQTVFNGGIKIVLIILVFLFFGIYPSWSLLLFPLAFFSLILTGTAIGLLVTPIGMLYTDIGKAIPLVMQFIMYITPIVFPMPKSGLALSLFTYNPLSQLFIVSRDWLSGIPTQFLNGFIIVNAIMIILLVFAWIIYRLVMPIIIERMSA
jgi:lipopolysaccharide transport system permease protein